MNEVYFNGPNGKIKGFYEVNDISRNKDGSCTPIVLLLHNNSNGTSSDKVINSVTRIFLKFNFSALQINIPNTKSSCDNISGTDELIDAATALDWLQSRHPFSRTLIVVGFSIGAWIAMQLIMRRPEITNFVVISTPVSKYDFSFLSPCPIPGLLIHGSQDSIILEKDIMDFVSKFSRQKSNLIDYNIISGADHFFRNKTIELSSSISEYIEYKCIQNLSSKDNAEDNNKQKQCKTKTIYLI